MNSKQRTPAGLERAGAIHDANQLLAVIAGRAGLMLRREEETGKRRQLAAIEQAARDVAALLARFDPEAPQPAAGPTELAEAAELVARLVLPLQTGADSVVVPAGRWTAVPGVIVRETLNNLLVNALEAAGETVRVRIGCRSEDEDHLLEIADDGPGIPAEVAARLLAEQVSSKTDPGRGVGLCACRERLREHGGDLELASTSESGTIFVLRLPASGPPPDVPDRPAGQAGCVLVVDDDAAVREMLEEVFGELGGEVTALRDAGQTRDTFRAGRFDLVVLDQGLPGTTGLDLARELRGIDPAVAIALISGWGQEQQLASADPGLVDFTAGKPLDWNRMQELLFEGTGLCRRRRDA